jgi:hypothetical protein
MENICRYRASDEHNWKWEPARLEYFAKPEAFKYFKATDRSIYAIKEVPKVTGSRWKAIVAA